MLFLKRRQLITAIFFISAAILFLPGISCQTDVKKFGSGGGGINDPLDPGEEAPLRIATVILDPFNVRQVAVYGEYGSRDEFLRACGFSGKSCICEFSNNADGENPKFTEDQENIAYDSVINLFYCAIPESEGINTVSHLRIRNRSKTRQSNVAIIKNMNPEEQNEEKQLEAIDLLVGLSLRDLREIYEYTCFFNYLEKEDTTSENFSCSPGELAILQIPYHYYLFSSSGTSEPYNNFDERVPDLLYNDGTGSFCQETIREVDCTTIEDGPEDPNAPSLRFGIFARSIGFFTKPILLSSAPANLGGTKRNYGFAMPTDSNGNCPPGFEPRIEYTAFPEEIANSTIDNGDINDGVGSPINNIVVDTLVRNPNNLEDLKLLVDRFGGGTCIDEEGINGRGELCRAPSLNRDERAIWQNVQSQDYKPDNNDPFCVIPGHLMK